MRAYPGLRALPIPEAGSNATISGAEDCQKPGSPSDDKRGIEKQTTSPTLKVAYKNGKGTMHLLCNSMLKNIRVYDKINNLPLLGKEYLQS